jgi:molybdopterin synthase sulfur carrier subunit
VNVRIPSPLRSYTGQQAVVTADGDTIDAVLADLDAQYRGIRFRMVDEQGNIRPHMKVFVNDESARDLAGPVRPTDEITIIQALSGG